MPKYASLLKKKGTIPTLPIISGSVAGSASFSPSDIAGLQGWYKDIGITNDGANTTGWNDSSGNGKNLTVLNSPPGMPANILNGHDVVPFTTSDGSNGTPLNRGSALMAGTASTTFFVGFKDSSWGEAGFYTTRAVAQANHHPFSDNAIYDTNFSTARKSCGTQVVTVPDNWRIFSIRSTANSYSMKIDGQAQFSTATNTFALGSDFILGCGAYDGANQTYALQGYMAEVIVYNAFLSDAQEDQVGGYLATRFGLTWTP